MVCLSVLNICLKNKQPMQSAATPNRKKRIQSGYAVSNPTLPAIKPPPQITATSSSRASALFDEICKVFFCILGVSCFIASCPLFFRTFSFNIELNIPRKMGGNQDLHKIKPAPVKFNSVLLKFRYDTLQTPQAMRAPSEKLPSPPRIFGFLLLYKLSPKSPHTGHRAGRKSKMIEQTAA